MTAAAVKFVQPVVQFYYRGTGYSLPIEGPCPLCGVAALVRLPPDLLAEQPDATTHVCHPNAGGCNHGFAEEE